MISDNIKISRKQAGLSQEELAHRLNVVRQTVSKWENGLSVPDAEALIQMADVLDVTVEQLLGVTPKSTPDAEAMAEELARLNQLLVQKNAQEARTKKVNSKRGLLLLLSFITMFLMLGIRNEVASALLSGACLMTACVVLYRNLPLLTDTEDPARLKALRITSLFSTIVLAVCTIVVVLTESNILAFTEESERIFVVLLVDSIMLFMGLQAPKLPHNRNIGLRLPWTVLDEETWNVAHRILGIISWPIALIYLACALTIPDMETVTVVAVGAWIGIPGLISGVFFWRKSREYW